MSRIKHQPITTVQLALTASFTTILAAVPTNCNTRANITVCNENLTTAYHFSLWKVPSGGSPGDTNILINQRVLPAKMSYPVVELNGLVFGAGETLQGSAEAATALTVTGGYIQYTNT